MVVSKLRGVFALGAGVCAVGLGIPVSAATFSEMAAPVDSYVAPVFTPNNAALAYLATDSAAHIRLAPLGASSSYLAVTAGGAATVTLSGATSFSFLWGSPDTYNLVTLGTSTGSESFSGFDFQTIFGLAAVGRNSNTRLVTIAATGGQSFNDITFSSGGNAFELAVATTPVPEPSTYALFLAGLGVVGWTARRRKS